MKNECNSFQIRFGRISHLLQSHCSNTNKYLDTLGGGSTEYFCLLSLAYYNLAWFPGEKYVLVFQVHFPPQNLFPIASRSISPFQNILSAFTKYSDRRGKEPTLVSLLRLQHNFSVIY